ncbi:unnamed protein product [Zymoseptoria tritici ST99CH_1A5]|uniref:Uncharacterized protein n=1 Tax=Zymoseptoria tritici ST99CH_1A5 TaxID=1276529 RepID=A0A1Y6M2S6_ZYMTR|nr:unnamed protein product [Zymoseptoria tritici ST99CH_1A5]
MIMTVGMIGESGRLAGAWQLGRRGSTREPKYAFRALDEGNWTVDFELANPYTPPPLRLQTLRLEDNSGIYASNFHVAYQEKGLTPRFAYREPGSGASIITLSVDGQKLRILERGELNQHSPWGVSRALCSFESLLDKTTEISTASATDDRTSHTESGTNPSTGPHFCATCFLGSPITPFGSTSIGFENKKDAKKAAFCGRVATDRLEDPATGQSWAARQIRAAR